MGNCGQQRIPEPVWSIYMTRSRRMRLLAERPFPVTDVRHRREDISFRWVGHRAKRTGGERCDISFRFITLIRVWAAQAEPYRCACFGCVRATYCVPPYGTRRADNADETTASMHLRRVVPALFWAAFSGTRTTRWNNLGAIRGPVGPPPCRLQELRRPRQLGWNNRCRADYARPT